MYRSSLFLEVISDGYNAAFSDVGVSLVSLNVVLHDGSQVFYFLNHRFHSLLPLLSLYFGFVFSFPVIDLKGISLRFAFSDYLLLVWLNHNSKQETDVLVGYLSLVRSENRRELVHVLGQICKLTSGLFFCNFGVNFLDTREDGNEQVAHDHEVE
jgi:hypothetical protein